MAAKRNPTDDPTRRQAVVRTHNPTDDPTRRQAVARTHTRPTTPGALVTCLPSPLAPAAAALRAAVPAQA